MKKSASIYLNWILAACLRIEKYVRNYDYKKFVRDEKTYDAVLMQFQHLGETANKLQENFGAIHDLPYAAMTGMRNFVSHNYLGVDPETVWSTIKNDLPQLKQQIKKLAAKKKVKK